MIRAKKSEPEPEDLIDFPQFEPFMKKCFGNDIEILAYKVYKFLPAGENFCSVIAKVEAVIRKTGQEKSNEEEEEELHLVVKMANSRVDEFAFAWDKMLEKEVFFYNELVPIYNDLEIEAGIPRDKVFNNVPKFYGYRSSLDDRSTDFDHNSVILMEDLNTLNYHMEDRQIGITLDQARLVVDSMAHFNALGIALKRKRPESFELIRSKAALKKILNLKQIEQMFQQLFKTIRRSDRLAVYMPKLEQLIAANVPGKSPPRINELWATIAHGDLRLNNVMFRKDESGKIIDDVKLYDFPFFMYHSALYDLAYFLNTALNLPTYDNHFDELTELYYVKFVDRLRLCGCDVSEFTRDAYETELRETMISKFAISAALIKVTTSVVVQERVKDEDNTFENVVLSEGSSVGDGRFVDRLIRVIENYKKHGWW